MSLVQLTTLFLRTETAGVAAATVRGGFQAGDKLYWGIHDTGYP